VIVRLMGEGQFRVPDDLQSRLNKIDEAAEEAVRGGDGPGFRARLDELHQVVHEAGERLADDDLSPSDAIIPPIDLSFDEAEELFAGEGLIPDLPS
jgi:hypothetical protein